MTERAKARLFTNVLLLDEFPLTLRRKRADLKKSIPLFFGLSAAMLMILVLLGRMLHGA